MGQVKEHIESNDNLGINLLTMTPEEVIETLNKQVKKRKHVKKAKPPQRAFA